MATPDFVLQEEYKYWYNSQESIIAAGTFVRPIKYDYVPKHIKEKETHWNYDKRSDVYCYTPRGIIALPKKIIRQVGGSALLDIDSYQ